jgi:beta-lactamase regulating signal transducer with metallopeptidase domain
VFESLAVVSAASDAAALRVGDAAVVAGQPSRFWNWQPLVPDADRWIGLAWLSASIVWFALLSHAVARLRRRRNSWREVETDAGRVLVSNDDGPAVVGFVRPRIVIPRWALVVDRETRALLLLHEREHLRANDSRVLFGAAVLLALAPWNAAFWWMSRRLRLAIEIDCDARVIRASGARHSYGHMLITIGERYVAPALPASAFLSEPGTHLEARIDAMTTPSARRPILAALPFALASAFVLGAAAWTPLPHPFRAAPQTPVVTAPVAQPPEVIPPIVSTPIVRVPRREQPAVVAPTANAVVMPADTATPTVAGRVLMSFSTNAHGIPDTVRQETPARRQFDALFAAFNSPDATRLEEFNKRYMRLDPVRDPTGEKGSTGLASYRLATGGFDILSIRRSQTTSLEFVARERAGSRATHVGYFAIVAADNPRIESFRMLIVQPGRGVDDAALIEHLQNMRP